MEEIKITYKCSACNTKVEDVELGCPCGGLVIGDVAEQIIEEIIETK